MKYFLSLILIGLGFLITWKADWIMNNFGRIPWAEQHLGMDGGTRLLWKLIGLATIIGAFMYMTGMWAGIFRFIFGGGSSGNLG